MNNHAQTIYDILPHNSVKKYGPGFSIEVEAEFKVDVSYMKTPFLVKRDGSLKKNGLEFISQGPNTKEKLLENVGVLFNTEEFNKYYHKSNRTSTHVHVNAQHWTLEQLVQILMVYYLCEPYLTHKAGVEREANLFCLRLYDADAVMECIRYIIDEQFTKVYYNFDKYKYCGLNIASIARLGTIEFRQMRGTNNLLDISKWLDYIDRIINYGLSFKTVEEAYTEVLRRPSEVLNYIFQENVEFFKYDDNYSYLTEIMFLYETRQERMNSYSKPKKYSYNFGEAPEAMDIKGF